jgi:hypothetical protein
VDWTASSDEAWCAVYPQSGSDDATLKVSISENASFTERTATITITAMTLTETVTVTQKGVIAAISVVPTAKEFDAAGGELAIAVTANTTWNAVLDGDWCTIDKTEGDGDAVVNLTVPENTTVESRGASITFTETTTNTTAKIDIVQAASNPSITATPTEIDFDAEGGSSQIGIASNVAWTCTSNADWCTIDVASGTGDGTVIVSAAANSEMEARNAMVTVTNGTDLTAEVTVSQEGIEAGRRTDSLALLSIYKAAQIEETEGDFDPIPSPTSQQTTIYYNSSKPIDTWTGVTVENDRVTRLVWASKSVKSAWTLPATIGHLTELRKLTLYNVALSGEIPEDLYDCVKLDSLDLHQNAGLTGTISSGVGNLTELVYINFMSDTGLTGELPDELGNCSKIQWFNFSSAGFTGSMPEAWSGMTSMVNFMFYSNHLTGPVPEIFGNMENLNIVMLNRSAGLTGTLPKSIVHCSKLTSFQAFECNFEGNIPEEYANLSTTLNQLRIQTNRLHGVVPAVVQAHPNWTKWTPDKYILPQQDGYGLTLE